MDKQEYKIRVAEIKDLLDHHQFAKAMEVCNLIDWRRVKNISMLCKVSEIYKINRKYAEAKDILLIAYERCPGGKMILYSLCELYIKMGDIVQAWECYKEYLQVAPNDSGALILQYKLYEAQDVSLEERIDVLKKYKEKEYLEKWAYELAYLYHRVGQETNCVEECDELILWFGDGKYVTKAFELKRMHQPLSPSQQEKYNQIMGIEPEKEEVAPLEEADDEAKIEEPQNTIHTGETIEIAPVNVDKFSTMNLQAELSKSMQEVMAEPEEAFDPGYSPTLEDFLQSQPVYDEPVSYNEEPATAYKEEPVYESQTYETEAAAEPYNYEAAPVYEAPVYVTPEYITEEAAEVAPSPEGYESALDKTSNLGEPLINSLLSQGSDGQISLVIPEEKAIEKQITGQMDFEQVMKEWNREKQEEASVTPTAQLPTIDGIDENDFMSTAEMPQLTQPIAEEPAVPAAPVMTDEIMDITTQELPTVDAIMNAIGESEDAEQGEAETAKETSVYEDIISEIEGAEADEAEIEEPAEEEETPEDEADALSASLEEEIEENFGEILRLRRMRSVIRETLRKSRMIGNTGNIIITGNEQSIRLKYALAVAKSKQHTDVDFTGKVAKIDADTLNRKDVVKAVSSLQGGALIIERAGELSINTMDALVKAVNTPEARLLFILEDEKASIKKLQKMREYVDKVFNIAVNIPTFSNNDLVDHAKEYAMEREYSIDDLGMLALYKRIDELQTASHYVTIEEVEQIMEEAISHADKKNMGMLMDILFGRRYDDDDLIILKEKDFYYK